MRRDSRRRARRSRQEYGAAIDRSARAYYCTSATGVEIPAERFLAACRYHGLAFTVVTPPSELVDPNRVSVCVRTDEAVYDLPRLRAVVTERLQTGRGGRAASGPMVNGTHIDASDAST